MVPGPGESRVDFFKRQRAHEESLKLGQPIKTGPWVEGQTSEELARAFLPQGPQGRDYTETEGPWYNPATYFTAGEEARDVPPWVDIRYPRLTGTREGVAGRRDRFIAGALDVASLAFPGQRERAAGEGNYGIGGLIKGASEAIYDISDRREKEFADQFRSAINPNVTFDMPRGLMQGQVTGALVAEGAKYMIGGGLVRKGVGKGVAVAGGTPWGQAAQAAVKSRFVTPATPAATAATAAIAPRVPAALKGPVAQAVGRQGARVAGGIGQALLDVAAFGPVDIITTPRKIDSSAYMAEMLGNPENRAQWEADSESWYSKNIAGNARAEEGLDWLHAQAEEALKSHIGRATFEAATGFGPDILLRSGLGAMRLLGRGGRAVLNTPPSGYRDPWSSTMLGDLRPDPEALQHTGVPLLEPGPPVRFDQASGLPLDPEYNVPLVRPGRLEGPEVPTTAKVGFDPETGLPLDPGTRLPLVGPPERLPGEVATGLEGRWFSRLQAAIEEAPTPLPGGKATGQEWNRFLNPAKRGFGEMEAGWTGIRKYLDDNADEVLTKDDVLSFAREHEIKLRETRHEGVGRTHAYDTQGKFGLEPEANYQEIVVQLDESTDPQRFDLGHFEDDALGHIRTTDREVTAVGGRAAKGKSLHVEELQSDWHQLGREIGYTEPRTPVPEEVRLAQEEVDLALKEVDDVIRATHEEGGRLHGLRIKEFDPDMAVTEDGYTILRLPDGRWHAGDIGTWDSAEALRESMAQPGMNMPMTWSRRDAPGEILFRTDNIGYPQETHTSVDVYKRSGLFEAMARRDRANSNLAKVSATRTERGAPDAPYKKTSEWLGLLVRRALQAAVKGGYDRISWATGAQVADLNNLQKHVSRIEYDPGLGVLRAWDLDGNMALTKKGVTPEDLPKQVGKGPAARLMDQQAAEMPDPDLRVVEKEAVGGEHLEVSYGYNVLPRQVWGRAGDTVFEIRDIGTNELVARRGSRADAEREATLGGSARRSIEGDDLVVGGHGMVAFYDRHVPNAFMKELKKYGAVLEEVDVIPPEKGTARWTSVRQQRGPDGPDEGYWLPGEEGSWYRVEGEYPHTGEWDTTPYPTEEAARAALGDEVPAVGERNLSIKITPQIRDAIEGGTRLAIPPRLVGPAAVGGVAGAAAPAETPEERARNIFTGATVLGSGFAAARSAFDVAMGSRRLAGNQLHTGIPTPEVPGRQAPSRYIRIPDEKTATNVRKAVKNREKSAATGKPMPGNPSNPRTVIRAAPGSGKPDVVVGDITQNDWIERTESMLSPEEITAAARWYEEVFPQFERAAGGDPEEIKKLVAAWLSANQNQSPETALKQVLRVREHILRGVPAEDLPAAGLPGVTRAVHDILTGKQATTVGPKISDFFDSAEGRTHRTWMGMDPEGGAPFVVDIHSARDTGLVDERLVNILKLQGYDSEALDALKLQAATEARYENRAEFGRALTGHLNSINWMGRSDWRASEIQAVGWAAMRKITAESDVQGISDVIEESTRRIAFEVLPGEHSAWDKKFSGRLGALPPKELAAVTREVGAEALRLAASETGVKDLAAVVHSIGGWEDAVTPNVVGRFVASQQAMDAVTARLGYYLDQTEVLGSTLRPEIKKPKAYAVDFLEVGTSTLRNDADLEKFWKVIQEADDTGTFKGFMPVEYADGSSGVRVIFDLAYVSEGIGGVGAPKLRASLEPGGAIYKALEGLDLGVIETRLFQTELSRSYNDFKGVPDGASHLQRIADVTGRGATNADLLNRKELTRSLEEALGAAEARAASARAGDAKPRVGGTTLGIGLGGAPPEMLAGAARVGGKAAVGGLAGGLLDASVGEDSPVEGMLVGAAAALSPSLARGFKNLRVRAEVADDAIDSALQQTLAAEQIAREAPEMMEGAAATATPPPEGVPPRTPAADKIDPEEFINIKKFGLEPGSTEERLKEAVQEVVVQTGMDPKEVVTHEQTIRIAESLGLDAQDIARRLGGAGGAPAGAEMLAARNIISSNVRRIDELFQQLKDNGIHIDSDEAAPYVAQINTLQGETNALLAKYMPASTATGRALNAMKIAAQDSMDPATWVIRAARVSGVTELPPSIAAEITRLTNAKDKQGLMKLLANLQKSDVSEQVVTIGKAAMLSAIPTHVMNLLGTAYNVFNVEHLKDLPAGKWFDPIISAWAGTERTKHWGSVAAQLEAAKKGAQQGLEGAQDVLHGRLPEGSIERWDQIRQVNIDLAQRTPLLKHVPALPKIIDRALDVFQKSVFGALGAGDAVLTGFAVQRSLAEQARVIALNEGLKGPELYARAAAILAEETTPEMMLEAVSQGMLATFRNQGIVGQGIAGMKRGIRQAAKKVAGIAGAGDPAHTATYMATEGLIPWSMTPSNVITRVAEMSPLGALYVAADPYFWKLVTKRVTKATESPAAQKRIVERLGRSTVGTAPLLLGIYLYNEGLLSLGWRQEKAGQRELTGEEENAWLMGDDWISMERLSPIGNMVILGGQIAHEWANARRDVGTDTAADIRATAVGGALSMGKTGYEMSFLESLRRVGEFFTGAERETGRKNLLAGVAGMFVPNILKRLNRWADPTMRPRETVGDKLLEGIPGGARLLGRPARVDPFGETRKYREGFYATMIDPFQMSRDKTIDDPVRAMMRDLDITISRRRKMDEETDQMYEQRQRIEGRTLKAAIASLMASSEFRGVGQQITSMMPGTDAERLELVTKAVQAEMVEALITSERTRYTRDYRAALGRRQLTGAAR